MRLPNLAKTYEELGQYGKRAFYDGRIAKSVADCVQNAGGFLKVDDLLAHESEWMEPTYTLYNSTSTNKTYKVNFDRAQNQTDHSGPLLNLH